jgi:hypothetical protein
VISATSALNLLDLTGTNVVKHGIETDALQIRSHIESRGLSLVLHEHSLAIDGILYDSRITKKRCIGLFERALSKLSTADVLIQNLKPGSLEKLGFAIDRLRRTFPRLITCSISGCGSKGPLASRKAYDLLIQAESGLASVTGGPDEPARVGISVVDIATGASAHAAILEGLLERARTGLGCDIEVSMFDVMADWLTVPLLHQEAGRPPRRLGLAHPSIAPYGVFGPLMDLRYSYRFKAKENGGPFAEKSSGMRRSLRTHVMRQMCRAFGQGRNR